MFRTAGSGKFDYSMVDDLLATILDRCDPYLVVIFGPVAKRSAKKGSDIDVMVVMDTDEKPIRRGLAILEALDIPTDVDLIVYTPEEYRDFSQDPDSFASEIMRTGEVVYGTA